jgi:hypothetical protein
MLGMTPVKDDPRLNRGDEVRNGRHDTGCAEPWAGGNECVIHGGCAPSGRVIRLFLKENLQGPQPLT